MIKKTILLGFSIIVLSSILLSCSRSGKEKGAELYKMHCANCHLGPDIQDLPKDIWASNILPDMGARMGIRPDGYDPLKGLSYEEMDAVIKTGIYPLKKTITVEDWNTLKEYIISEAPDSLAPKTSKTTSKQLHQFFPVTISFDDNQPFSFTYLEYDSKNNQVVLGDMNGELLTFDLASGISSLGVFDSPVISYVSKENESYLTTIGYIHPSAIPKGRVYNMTGSDTALLEPVLHRPVHMLVNDLNEDGKDELVLSEFGDLTGQLSFLRKEEDGRYAQQLLLNQPGTIRVVAQDMDADGRKDLIALTSQGDESITILFQKGNLKFEAKKVLRFSPVYGSSWFELIDYDNDGDLDIITVHGDNADKSYVQKPYHGMRIHINDGTNIFTEHYFYPLNGATRIVASDFDKDGDIDFGLLSTFPDYENAPERTFVFLENINPDRFEFESYTLADSRRAKWFLMDKGDIDQDGDEDIILSAFALPFIPAPENLEAYWREQAVDMMILKNNLIP